MEKVCADKPLPKNCPIALTIHRDLPKVRCISAASDRLLSATRSGGFDTQKICPLPAIGGKGQNESKRMTAN
jgi:hypothetical protein